MGIVRGARFAILVVLLIATVLVVPCSAYANFLVFGCATDFYGRNRMTNLQIGKWPYYKTGEHAPTTPTAAQLSVLDYRYPYDLLFRMLDVHPPRLWDLILHAGPDYASDMAVLKLWTSSGALPSGESWGTYQCDEAVLRVDYDPAGYYTHGQVLWRGVFGAETSEEDPTVEIIVHVNRTIAPWQYGLRLTFGDESWMVIPEPSCLGGLTAALSAAVLVSARRRR